MPPVWVSTIMAARPWGGFSFLRSKGRSDGMSSWWKRKASDGILVVMIGAAQIQPGDPGVAQKWLPFAEMTSSTSWRQPRWVAISLARCTTWSDDLP